MVSLQPFSAVSVVLGVAALAVGQARSLWLGSINTDNPTLSLSHSISLAYGEQSGSWRAFL